MGASVKMEICMTSRTERQGLAKAVPCRMAALLSGLLLVVILLGLASEVVADGNVTVESITIFNTHEWFGQKPTVYFQCHEEEKVYLPDVLEKDVPYTFLGQESWQPLTTLYGTKCKRCGIYEQDTVKADDTFYEWELCPNVFSSLDGRNTVFQEKEFNATFICNDCIPDGSEGETIKSDDDDDDEEEEGGAAVAFLIVVVVLVVLVGLGVVAYSKWRQKRRAEQQARFVKMFEDDDDFDTELGLVLTRV